ncbi:MAG: phage tail protein, partial [Thermodesulfobacteriota bacterium]
PVNHKIKTGDQITFSKKVGGDSDDWRTFATLGVIIVAAVAAPYIAGPVLGLEGAAFWATSAAISAGIQYGGMRLIDHYMPLPDPEGNVPERNKSPSYSSAGWREANPNREGLVIPLIMGRVKVKPPITSVTVEQTQSKHYNVFKTSSESMSRWSGSAVVAGEKINSVLLRMIVSENKISNIERVLVNSIDLNKSYTNFYEEYWNSYKSNPDKAMEPQVEIPYEDLNLSFRSNMKDDMLVYDGWFFHLLNEKIYEMLWSKGGDHANSRNDLFFDIGDGYEFVGDTTYLKKVNGLIHRRFHQVNGFTPYSRPFQKAYNDEEYNPTTKDYRDTMLKEDSNSYDNNKNISPSFDKKIISHELDKSKANSDDGYVTVSPKQSVNPNNQLKAVYVTIRFPRGCYEILEKIEEDDKDYAEMHGIVAGDHLYMVQSFNVQVRVSGGAWRDWGPIYIKANTTSPATYFLGPFYEDYTRSEIDTMLANQTEQSEIYPDNLDDFETIGYLKKTFKEFLDISDIPSITKDMDIRINYGPDTYNSSYHVNDAVIEAVYSYYDYDLQTYPGCAFMDLRLGASDAVNGSIPKIEMVVESSVLDIKDSGSDQVLQKAANNPAWQALKLLTDEEIGLGIPFEDIVISDFQEWADFCVNEGIESNYIIDTQASFSDQIKPIYTLGRAYPVKKSSKHSILIDKPAPVAQIFNDSNIIKDSFSLVYLSEKDQANIFELEYMDAAQNFEKRTLEQRHPTNTINRENRIKYSLFNCTERLVAKKHLTLMANKNMWCKKIVKFAAKTDAINCELGDVINVNYRNVSWGIHSGRILKQGLTEYEFYISGNFRFESGKSYYALVRDISTDGLETLSIQNKADNADYSFDETNQETLITFNELPQNGTIQPDAVVTIGENSNVGKLFRITQISRQENNKREISALEYYDEVYNTDNVVDDDPDDTPVETVIPEDINVKEIYQESSSNKSSLYVSWTGHCLSTVVSIYLNSKKIITKESSGNFVIIDPTEELYPNSNILITVSSSSQGPVQENQRLRYHYEGYPYQLENVLNVEVSILDSNRFKLHLNQNLPNFIDFSEITAKFNDVKTGTRKSLEFGSFENRNDFIVDTKILPGQYVFRVYPHVNEERIYQPIKSEIITVAPEDIGTIYLPNVTGLRQANGQTKWTTRDAEITWDHISDFFETKAGTNPGGAGNDESRISYRIDIKNSVQQTIKSEIVTTNFFRYSLEQNTEDNNGTPEPHLTFHVYAVNQSGVTSKAPAILELDHVPPQVEEFMPKSFVGGVFFSWAIRYPELLKEYRYKRKVTESEETPDWSSVSNWEKMIGNVYSYTFSKEEAESK